MTGGALVLGVGNRHRGDDAAGLRVLDALTRRAPAGVRLCALEGAPVELSRHWSPGEAVVIVDAARGGGGPPGSVYRFDALAQPLPQGVFALSTHALGVGEGIELARALGQLPQSLVVFGIEGLGYEHGAPLSPPVASAVEELAQRLAADPRGGAQRGGPACTSKASSEV